METLMFSSVISIQRPRTLERDVNFELKALAGQMAPRLTVTPAAGAARPPSVAAACDIGGHRPGLEFRKSG